MLTTALAAAVQLSKTGITFAFLLFKSLNLAKIGLGLNVRSISRGKSMGASKYGKDREEGNTPATPPLEGGSWIPLVGTVPGKPQAEQWWASPWSPPQRCSQHTPVHAGTYWKFSSLFRNSAICP